MQETELKIQCRLTSFLDRLGVLWAASQNGYYANSRRKAMSKASGLKNGFPDIQICQAMGNWHGFYLELKTTTGKASIEQMQWQESLLKRGYCCVIAYGFEDACYKIEEYLKL